LGSAGDQGNVELDPLASRYENRVSWFQVIWWWESRRIRYYVTLFILGAISFPTYCLFLYLADRLKPGEDAVEPLMLIFGPVIVNVLYTGGWTGPSFSIFIVAFPAVWEVAYVAVTPSLTEVALKWATHFLKKQKTGVNHPSRGMRNKSMTCFSDLTKGLSSRPSSGSSSCSSH